MADPSVWRWWRRSLQGRLLTRMGALLLLSLAVVAVGVTWRSLTTVRSVQSRSLVAQAADLRAALTDSIEGTPLPLPVQTALRYDPQALDLVYALWGGEGEMLRISDPAAAPVLAEAFRTREMQPERIVPRGPIAYALLTVPAIHPGQWLTVGQVRDTDDDLTDDAMAELVEDVVVAGIPLLLIAAGIAVFSVRHSLAPVRHLSDLATAIVPGADARLPDADVPLEMQPLVMAVNGALDRLARSIDQQRRLTADAAHHLRTPLAILHARIDGLAAGEERSALQQDVERMAHVIDQLLIVARLEADAVVELTSCDLAGLLRDQVVAMAPMMVAKGCVPALDGADIGVSVVGDPRLLGIAIQNLLENAVKYSPHGGEIIVTLHQDGECAVVTIRDHGIGLGGAGDLFTRFQRGLGAQNVPGAGLGLSIVREILHRHGGDIDAAPANGGGAEFRFWLPVRSA